MKKAVILFISCVVLSGCVSTRQLDQSITRQLAGKTLQPAVLPAKSSFDIFTCGNATAALGGAIGGAVYGTTEIGKDGDIIKRYQIEDPAVYAAVQLTGLLTNKYHLTGMPPVKITPKDSSAESIMACTRSADYILSVQTTAWGFYYYPLNWKTYRPLLAMHVQLIEVRSGKVIAEQKASYISKTPAEDAPTYKELLQNNAQGIKSHLKTAARELVLKINKAVF